MENERRCVNRGCTVPVDKQSVDLSPPPSHLPGAVSQAEISNREFFSFFFFFFFGHSFKIQL